MEVALVTGTSSGIGLAIAQRLVESGFNVYGYTRDKSKISYNHNRFHPIECDITDTQLLLETTKTLIQKTGSLKVLVNNAGIARNTPAEQISDKEWLEVMDININSIYFP